MNPFHWTCPYCNRDTTITSDRVSSDYHNLEISNSSGYKRISTEFVVCPNPDCKKFVLVAALYPTKYNHSHGEYHIDGDFERTWNLIPSSNAKAFPDYIPQVIIDDYNEACLIVDLSPKASATLSRRCIQGILRDFWSVKPGRLVDEIKEIEDKIDPLTWAAIEAVRKVGNIGAHMEKDINVIVEVDPQEATLLIGLIETLLKDWYILREERKGRLSKISGLTNIKDKKKES